MPSSGEACETREGEILPAGQQIHQRMGGRDRRSMAGIRGSEGETDAPEGERPHETAPDRASVRMTGQDHCDLFAA